MRELDFEEVNAVALRAARAAASKVRGSTAQDLAQDCWVWITKNQETVASFADDTDGGFGRLYRSLYHYCLDVAQRELAQASGYKAQDNYFYSITTLRNALPYWFEETSNDPVLPDRDMKMDMDLAWKRLDLADRRLLARCFKGDPDPGLTYQALAVEWGISDDAARKRVDGVLRRLQRLIGGERPTAHTSRKVRTNAAARADLSNHYE